MLGVPVAVVEQDAVVGLPCGHDRLALLVGRQHGDDVVEHLRQQVGRLARRGRRAPSRSVDDLRLERPSSAIDGGADRFGACGPCPILDLVDRRLGGEEQRPDPERGEQQTAISTNNDRRIGCGRPRSDRDRRRARRAGPRHRHNRRRYGPMRAGRNVRWTPMSNADGDAPRRRTGATSGATSLSSSR